MSEPKFKPGDQVAITAGPLEYHDGEVCEVYIYPDGDPDSLLEAPWYYILGHGWLPESWLRLI